MHTKQPDNNDNKNNSNKKNNNKKNSNKLFQTLSLSAILVLSSAVAAIIEAGAIQDSYAAPDPSQAITYIQHVTNKNKNTATINSLSVSVKALAKTGPKSLTIDIKQNGKSVLPNGTPGIVDLQKAGLLVLSYKTIPLKLNTPVTIAANQDFDIIIVAKGVVLHVSTDSNNSVPGFVQVNGTVYKNKDLDLSINGVPIAKFLKSSSTTTSGSNSNNNNSSNNNNNSGSSSSGTTNTSSSSNGNNNNNNNNNSGNTGSGSTSNNNNNNNNSGNTGSGTITVYGHRVQSSYWAPCFATTCDMGTGPGASMFFTLYGPDQSTVVATGFANENGYTFTGLNTNTVYYLYPADCDSCHNSHHNVYFDHWGDDNSNTRPRAVSAGSSLHAWFACTDTCS